MAAPSFLEMVAGAAADLANAATGKLRLFFDVADGLPKIKNDAGTVTSLVGPVGPGYGGTSVTSLLIGTGSKVFTTQAGLAYTAGARVRASSAAAPTVDYMEGVVASYSGTTLTVTMDLIGGSGTHTDWDINIAGNQGVQGAGVPADVTAHGNLGATATFDYASGAQPEHSGTLNAACTFTFSNAAASGKRTLMTLQLAVAAGGPYAVTLPASVSNKAAAEAFLSAVPALNHVILPFTTIDGGTVWDAVLETTPTLTAVLGVSAGQNIANALTGAASPTAGNVFATMADIAAGSGTDLHPGPSFPGSPAANWLCYRTDLGMLFYYDGTRWLTVQIFHETWHSDGNLTTTGTAITPARAPMQPGGLDRWIIDVFLAGQVQTTNNGSNYWTANLKREGSDTVVAAPTTAAWTASAKGTTTVSVGALTGTSDNEWYADIAKTGAPGPFYPTLMVRYRLKG